MGTSTDLLLQNKYFICFAGLDISLKSVIFLSGTCCLDSSLLVHGKIDRVFRRAVKAKPVRNQKISFSCKNAVTNSEIPRLFSFTS